MEKEGVEEGVLTVGVGTMEVVKDTVGVGVRSVGVGAIERVREALKLGGAAVPVTVPPPLGGESVGMMVLVVKEEMVEVVVEEGVNNVGVGSVEGEKDSTEVGDINVGVGVTDCVVERVETPIEMEGGGVRVGGNKVGEVDQLGGAFEPLPETVAIEAEAEKVAMEAEADIVAMEAEPEVEAEPELEAIETVVIAVVEECSVLLTLVVREKETLGL